MADTNSLSTSDKVAIFALIITVALQAIPLNAAIRSLFLLIALGAGVYLCWHALWARWKKWTLVALLIVAYVTIVLLLFEQEARAAKSVAPTTVMAGAIFNTLWGMPWRWILPAVVGFALAKLFTPIRQYFLRVESSNSQLLARAKRIRLRVPRETDAKCAYEWVHQIADKDKDSIKNLVRIPRIAYHPHFDKKEPYIDFVFSIFNNSLYDVVIDNSIKKGDIWCDSSDEPFYYEPKIQPANRPIICRSRDGTGFFIRHNLTVEEVSRFDGRENVIIGFSDLEITFTGTEQFPEIGLTKLETNYYLETKKGVRRYDQDESIFAYTNEQWALLSSSNKQEVAALKAEINSLKSQVDEQVTPKLTFEIDDKQSQVHMSGGREVKRIEASVKLRCLKSADSTMAVLDFHASLHKRTPTGEEVMVPREGATIAMAHPSMEKVVTDGGWAINQPITPYRWYKFFLELTPEMEGQLSREYFLRVTMFVVGQDPLLIDFYVDSWNDARQSNSGITLKR